MRQTVAPKTSNNNYNEKQKTLLETRNQEKPSQQEGESKRMIGALILVNN